MGWFDSRFVGWLFGRFVGWLISLLVNCPGSWSAGCLDGRLIALMASGRLVLELLSLRL